MDPAVVWKGALPPIAAALLFVTCGGVRLLPLAVGLGLLVAYGLLKAWPALPHELWAAPNGIEWLLWVVAAACVVATLEHLAVLPAKLAGALAVATAGAGTWLVLQKVAAAWSGGEALLHVGGGGLAVALLALGHRAVVARAPAGRGLAVLFSVVLSVDAVLLVVGSSALLGQLCGAVAAALGAAAGTSLWRRPFALAVADGSWLGIAHGVFLAAGVHLAYLSWPAACLAAIAPMLPLALPRSVAERHPRRWLVASAALVLVALAVALGSALAGQGSF